MPKRGREKRDSSLRVAKSCKHTHTHVCYSSQFCVEDSQVLSRCTWGASSLRFPARHPRFPEMWLRTRGFHSTFWRATKEVKKRDGDVLSNSTWPSTLQPRRRRAGLSLPSGGAPALSRLPLLPCFGRGQQSVRCEAATALAQRIRPGFGERENLPQDPAQTSRLLVRLPFISQLL